MKRLVHRKDLRSMATVVPAMNFNALLDGVPRGAWVSISADRQKVLSFGSDVHDVIEEAKQMGEKDPIIMRVPEFASALVL
jgi:hypothetical protein